MKNSNYDIVIVGGGIAGLTAGLYSSRAGLNTLLLEGASLGGQAILTDTIENFPGFPEGIGGFELITKLKQQAERFGLEIELAKAREITVNQDGSSLVKLSDNQVGCLGLILAVGAEPMRLSVKGEQEFTGKGVSYCATCDGPMFKNKEVVVVGGGNAAVEEALFLERFCKKIFLVHRRDMLRAAKVLQDRLFKSPKLEFVPSSVVEEIKGDKLVEEIILKNVKDKKLKTLKINGVFIFVGTKPNTEFLKGLVDMDETGYILTKEDMQTSQKGIYACGDARRKPLKQLVTAAGEAAEASYGCMHHVQSLKGIVYK